MIWLLVDFLLAVGGSRLLKKQKVPEMIILVPPVQVQVIINQPANRVYEVRPREHADDRRRLMR